MARKRVVSWRREESLAIATIQASVFELVSDLAQVDAWFDEIEGFEQDATIDALAFLPAEDEPPPSTLRGEAAGRAQGNGMLSLLRSFTVLSRLALHLAEGRKLVAVGWRDAVDPIYLSVGLAASFRVVAENTEIRLVNPELKLPPLGGLDYLLPAYIGIAQARSLLLSGEALPATRALELGLVDAIVPEPYFCDDAVSEIQRLARTHIEGSRLNRPFFAIDAEALHARLRHETHIVERARTALVGED